jgi:hypothetical protein
MGAGWRCAAQYRLKLAKGTHRFAGNGAQRLDEMGAGVVDSERLLKPCLPTYAC